MKIITDNVAYVQKNDLAYLTRSGGVVPASIFTKFLNDEIVIVIDSNRYEFVEFNDPEEIEFFKSVDWMVDYASVKDLSDEEITSLAGNILAERNAIAEQFNSMSPEEKKKNVSMYFRSELLDFKMLSLRDFVWFRQGNLTFDLPEGVELPDGFVRRCGFGKLIRSMLNKGKKIKNK